MDIAKSNIYTTYKISSNINLLNIISTTFKFGKH